MKRKFLIASADKERRELVADVVSAHIDLATVLFAEDGLNALQKVDNDPPHVLLLDPQLPRLSGEAAVESILQKRKDSPSIVFISSIPEAERFVEAVASGRVQFVDPEALAEQLPRALARAMNWLSLGDGVEFALRFAAPGDVLVREGESADYVYILRRGRMKACLKYDVPGEEEILLGYVEPQEFIGEMAYVSGERRSATVVAVADCELIEIPINHLDHLLFQKPVWSRALMKTLSKRVKAGNGTIATKAG